MINSHDLNQYFEKEGFNKKTTTNYVSDINQFLKWIKVNFAKDIPSKDSAQNYKEHLHELNIPRKTINRKLSSLRHLAQFLNSGFMEGVTNISVKDALIEVKPKRITPSPLLFASVAILMLALILIEVTRTPKVSAQEDITPQGLVKITSFQIPQDLATAGNLKITIQKDPNNQIYYSTNSGDNNVAINLASNSQENYVTKNTSSTEKNFGDGVITEGSTETKIENNYIDGNTSIIITPKTETSNKVLYVKNQGSGWATIAIEGSINKDIDFNWLGNK